MGRQRRLEVAGGFFHVTARGNDRRRIFRDDLDHAAFVRMLGRTVERFEWRCHAYCLMPNHFHLALETPRTNLGSGMRHLNGSYAQRFNVRWERVGHVFQGRYRSVLVERESHLLEVVRYVVLNPVRAGLCDSPGTWPWSSFRATAGLEPTPTFLARDLTLAIFGRPRPLAEERYRRFVAEGHPARTNASRDPVAGRGSDGLARLG
jgi:REP element-mobilizing transposase RayT